VTVNTHIFFFGLILTPNDGKVNLAFTFLVNELQTTCLRGTSVGLGLIFFFFFFLLSTKPEIVVPGSGIRFRYLIFENSGKMTNYAVFLPSLLLISTKS
jgi:hypothetical protein